MSERVKVPTQMVAWEMNRRTLGKGHPVTKAAKKAADAAWKELTDGKELVLSLRVRSVAVYDVYGGASGGGVEEGGNQETFFAGAMADASGGAATCVSHRFITKQGGKPYLFGGEKGAVVMQLRDPKKSVTWSLMLMEDDSKARDAANYVKRAVNDNELAKRLAGVATLFKGGQEVGSIVGDAIGGIVGTVTDLLATNGDDYLGGPFNTESESDFFGVTQNFNTHDTGYAKIEYRWELWTV